MRIAFVVNYDYFFLSHRLPLALEAINKGYEVYLLAIDTGKRSDIESYGIKFINYYIKPTGKNPIQEIKTVLSLRSIYKKIKPDIIHHITLKVSLLGCIAAKSLGLKCCVNAISGFGYAFTDERKGLLQSLIKTEMAIAFRGGYWQFILQNPDDMEILNSLSYINDNQLNLIRGSGVDLNQFSYKEPIKKEKVQLLFAARMLGDKGVRELIAAMKSVRNQIIDKACLVLAGDCNSNNPTVLSENEIKSFLESGYIEWIGYQNDMVKANTEADIAILPSYREGLPKTLIEACAIGRPIITTDVTGCKECVKDGYNGILVPLKNVEKLAEAIVYLVNNDNDRIMMGKNSRTLAEQYFSIDIVIKKHFDIYNRIKN